MPRPKQVAIEDRQTVTVSYEVLPYFAVQTSDPGLRGIRGVGPSPRLAIENLRSEVRRRYPNNKYDIVERVVRNDITSNPEWSLD